jgi:hypothetical protein
MVSIFLVICVSCTTESVREGENNMRMQKILNKELHNSRTFLTVIQVDKSRKMIWLTCVELIGEKGKQRILITKSEGKRQLGSLEAD